MKQVPIEIDLVDFQSSQNEFIHSVKENLEIDFIEPSSQRPEERASELLVALITTSTPVLFNFIYTVFKIKSEKFRAIGRRNPEVKITIIGDNNTVAYSGGATGVSPTIKGSDNKVYIFDENNIDQLKKSDLSEFDGLIKAAEKVVVE